MTNLAWPPTGTAPHGLAKWARLVLLVIAVIALMALSFTLGRATIGHAGPMKPADQSIIQPLNPLTGPGQVGCRQHAQC
jgi:hypothetical protein